MTEPPVAAVGQASGDAVADIQDILRQRALRLAARRNGDGAEEGLRRTLLVIGMQKERYAFDLMAVAEVTRPRKITVVPGAGKEIMGVVSLHGEICPVIDLERVLGLGGGRKGVGSMVFLRRAGVPVGLGVERMEGIRDIAEADIERVTAGQQSFSNFVEGVTRESIVVLRDEAIRTLVSRR